MRLHVRAPGHWWSGTGLIAVLIAVAGVLTVPGSATAQETPSRITNVRELMQMDRKKHESEDLVRQLQQKLQELRAQAGGVPTAPQQAQIDKINASISTLTHDIETLDNLVTDALNRAGSGQLFTEVEQAIDRAPWGESFTGPEYKKRARAAIARLRADYMRTLGSSPSDHTRLIQILDRTQTIFRLTREPGENIKGSEFEP